MTLPASIAVSSVPLFQDTLKTELQARSGLSGVEVVIGPPSPGIAQVSKWIALIDVKGTEKYATFGRYSREENYEQSVYVSVMTRDGEGDAKRGRDIAYGIKNEIAQCLITIPTVGGSVWQAELGARSEFFPRLGITVSDTSGAPAVDLTWREAALYFDIKVKNRLVTA